MKKAISIEVYRHGDYDCTCNGVSKRFDTLLVEHEEGWIKFDETNPPENLVKVVTRKLFGKEYTHLEPVVYKTEYKPWFMFGGNFGYTNDSRWSKISQYPLPIHDRVEG